MSHVVRKSCEFVRTETLRLAAELVRPSTPAQSQLESLSDCYNPSITSPMKNLLSLGLACSLLLSPKSIGADAGLMADSKKVSAVEYLYADVSDANTILATIDSGLLSSYQGKDRAAWEKFYGEKRAKLAKELERLPASGFSGADTRAIAAMRKQLKGLHRRRSAFQPVGQMPRCGPQRHCISGPQICPSRLFRRNRQQPQL